MPSALRLVRRVCGIGGAVVFAFGLPRSVGAQLVPMPLAPMDTLVRHDPCVSQKIAKARFTIAPYGWLLGIHGDVGVRDLDAHVNISFSDLLSKLRWGAMGGFEFNYGHWLGTFDGVFASVHQENTPSVGGFNPDIDSRLDLAMTQAFVGYTFRARPNLAIDLLGGARLWRWDASLRLQGENITRQRERIRTFVDALGGVRVRWEPTEKWYVALAGDGGGGGSKATAEGMGTIGYDVSRHWNVFTGYRYLYGDYAHNNFSFKGHLGGPVLGGAYRW